MFQDDISGKNNKDEQPENIAFRFIILLIFHFDISGNDFKDEQL